MKNKLLMVNRAACFGIQMLVLCILLQISIGGGESLASQDSLAMNLAPSLQTVSGIRDVNLENIKENIKTLRANDLRLLGSQGFSVETSMYLSMMVLAIAIASGILLTRAFFLNLQRLKKSNQELEYLVKEKSNELDASKASLQRTNFLLYRREQQLRRQQEILFGLSKDKSINQGDFIVAVQNVTRTGSYALGVERVSIWLFNKNKTVLHCLDLYQRSLNLHTEADVLTAEKYPKFFHALLENHTIAIEDIQEEEQLQELVTSYFEPCNIVSILLSRFEVGGEIMGIVAFEHTEIEHLWLEEEISFVNSLADLLSLGMEAQERKRAEESLRVEQKKSERLLLNVLPQEIAERLKSMQSFTKVHLKTSGTIVADSFDEVTVLFADIVNFTEYASSISPSELVNVLNDIFSEFDHLVEQYELEKIKTIGDSYMVVGGLPIPRDDHAESIAEMALNMQSSIQNFKRSDGNPFSLRIGIHTGQAIAGVIGTKKFIYDLWGDTVNVASRMESQGIAGCIQVTEATYQLLRHKYHFDDMREIDIKGKGIMRTYLLIARKV